MGYGWLQRDHRWPHAKLLRISHDGLAWKGAGAERTAPLWLTVSCRNFDNETGEVAVQIYTAADERGQFGYGSSAQVMHHEERVVVQVALDWYTQPVDPEGQVGWPATGAPIWWELTLEGISMPAGPIEVETYRLEWWHKMLNDVASYLRQELESAAYANTLGAGYAAPDAYLVLVSGQDTGEQREGQALEARFKDALVVVHGAHYVEPEPDMAGGHGRVGRKVEADVTIFVRNARGMDAPAGSTGGKDHLVLHAGYLVQDLLAELDPPNERVNLLGGYLAFSRCEQVVPPSRVPTLGMDVVAASMRFTAYKYEFEEEGAEEPGLPGEGVRWTFNQGFIQAEAGFKMNDHGLVFVPATGLYHKIGIICAIAQTGSAYFDHYTSPDCRTWTRQADVLLGSGTNGNWRCQVWSPHPFANPGYGLGGALSDYRWLMYFTGASWLTTQLGTSEQKIGLAGCLDNELATWAVLNGDAPVYWTRIGGVNAAWAYNYDTDWNRFTRDGCVFTDGANWYLAVLARSTNTNYLVVGLAKIAGGTSPNFLSLAHEPNPVVVSTSSGGWQMESTFLLKVGTLWHLFPKGTSGTRHQSGASIFGPPWSGSQSGGVLLMNAGGYPAESGSSYGEASELCQLSGSGLLYAMTGHLLETPGGFYFNAMVELDFSACDVAGEHPTVRPMCGVLGLVGLREGAMDLSLRWSVQDSQGALGAFYRQPVWGDQAAAGGEGASGMSGNSYLNTQYQQDVPGRGLDGVAWPDDSRVGWIQSTAWELTRNRLSVKIGGAANLSGEFVALVRESDGRVLWRVTGGGSHVLEERLLDTTSLRSLGRAGVRVYLAVVDQGTAAGDYIALDEAREYERSGSDPVTPELPLADGPLLTDLITI